MLRRLALAVTLIFLASTGPAPSLAANKKPAIKAEKKVIKKSTSNIKKNKAAIKKSTSDTKVIKKKIKKLEKSLATETKKQNAANKAYGKADAKQRAKLAKYQKNPARTGSKKAQKRNQKLTKLAARTAAAKGAYDQRVQNRMPLQGNLGALSNQRKQLMAQKDALKTANKNAKQDIKNSSKKIKDLKAKNKAAKKSVVALADPNPGGAKLLRDPIQPVNASIYGQLPPPAPNLGGVYGPGPPLAGNIYDVVPPIQNQYDAPNSPL